jgi:hypothetical protein
MLDKFQQIISEAEYALAIIGDVDTGEFSLVDPSLAGIEDFLGVVAIVQGRPRSAFAKVPPPQIIDAIAHEMCRRMEVAIIEIERVLDMPAN